MRKALIGLILAATVLTPLAAQAQERGERRSRHVQQEDSAGSQQGDSGERRAQRQEWRQQRQEQRQQRQVQVQQPQTPVEVAQRDRRGGGWRGNDGNRGGDRGSWQGNDGNRGGDRGSWRGGDGNRGNWRGGDQNRNSTVQGWGGPNTPEYREHADRYNRRAQENALRYGTQEQRREVYRQRRGDGDGNWRGDRDRNWRDGRRGDWRNNWNRGWRNDRRYDWNRWRYSNRHIYRLPPYYSPYRSHRYSRFSIGLFLDSLFYDQRYWIGDPWQYRLPAAPPGTQWVRYYNDVILVDVYSGEVIDVIYDFFW